MSVLDLRRSWIFFGLLFVILIGVSWPVISAHPKLEYDESLVFDPLKKVHSLQDYWQAREQNSVIDILPIRDLSYWLEFQIADQTGFENIQLVNVLLWYATLLVLYAVLGRLAVTSPLREMMVLMIGLHPVMHSSVYWTIGRKHLLSAFFILAATWFLLRDRRISDRFWMLIFFLLANLSQPINIGFPIFVALWYWKQNQLRSRAVILSIMLVVATVLAVLNSQYYSSEAYSNIGGALATKFTTESWEMIGKRFLVWGRDFFQIFIPVKPAVFSYRLQSIESYLGLIGLGVFLAFAVKWRQKLRWEWLVLASLPVAVVTVKLTAQGGMDTYLLTPLLAVGIFLSLTLQDALKNWNQKAWIACGLVIVFFGTINFGMASVWSNQQSLFEYGYESDRSLTAGVWYARWMLNQPNPDLQKVFAIADETREQNPKNIELPYLYGKAIYLSPVSPDQQEAMFRQYDLQEPWFDYYWSALDARQGRYAEAYDRVTQSWDSDPLRFYTRFQNQIFELNRMWGKMCELAKRKDCDQVRTRIDEQRQKVMDAKRTQ